MRATMLMVSGIAAAVGGVLLTPAAIASAADNAAVTIAVLEAQGFDVKVDRLGGAPLDECVVTDVRNPREQTRVVRRGDDVITVVDKRTITVSLDCSR